MSRTLKQIICTILVPVMLLGIFPTIGLNTSTEAEAASQITCDDVIGIISDIWEQTGNKYWCGNHGLEYLKNRANNGNYSETVQNKRGDSNHFHGIECNGFARWVEYCIFKEEDPFGKWKKHYEVPEGYTLKPGDFLNINGSAIASHYAVVWKVNKEKDEITIIEGNWGGYCKVNKRTIKYTEMEKQLNSHKKSKYGQTCYWECPAKLCEHVYDESTGICTKTGCGYNYYDENKISCTGTVTPKSGESYFYVYNYPYAASGRVQKNGKDLKVTSANLVSWGENFYKGIDHRWYEVKVPGDNKSYYVFHGNVTSGMKPNFSFSLKTDGFKSSYTADTKNSVTIKGSKVTSTSDMNLLSVKAEIINVDTGKTLYTYTKSGISSRSWTFDSAIDSAMGFSKITSAGNYQYVVTATDSDGNTGNNTKSFKVVSKSQSTQVTHTVTFDANGGYGAPGSQTVKSGDAVNLDVTSPVRNGYTFKGWSLDSGSSSADITNGYKPTDSVTLYAVWEEIPAPSAPTMTNMTYDIGLGGTVNVSWNSSNYASSYIVSVFASNGTEIESLRRELYGTVTTFMFDDKGTYTIKVKAKNSLGEESAYSTNCITAVVHPSSTVTFKNYDGTTLATHTVAYGQSTTQPNSPTRTGYDFVGWNGSFLNVTSDRTITAEYKPKEYKVTFYDCNGDALPTQTVTYTDDTPGSATEPTVEELKVPENYTFVGWDTNEWTSVTKTGIEVKPVYVWADKDVPITSKINSVTAAGQGYWVDYTITNHVSTAQLGRVVVLAKNQYGKFICQTESGAFYMGRDGESIESKIYVYVNEKDEVQKAELFSELTTIELLVVDSYEDMVPIAEPVTSYTPDMESKLWTDWMTETEYKALDTDSYSKTETKTQYKVSTRSEVTSESSSYAGYTRLDSKTTSYKSAWSSWSSWSTTPVSKSDNVDVETRTVTVSEAHTEYRYGTFTNSNKHYPSNVKGKTKEYTTWSTTKYNLDKDNWNRAYKCGSDYKKEDGTNTYYQYKNIDNTGKMYYWHLYYKPGAAKKNSNCYYWEETRNVAAQTETQYRYRTRTDINVYTYEKWSGYTGWSDTYAVKNDNTEVKTQKLYRVCMKATTPKDGTNEYTVNVPEAAGKQAIFSVYKVDQASDYSNEYIEQVTLGTDGKHTFKFDTLKECTAETGDFTMTLTIEGSKNPLYVGTIEAPKKEYTVNFIDSVDNTYICDAKTVKEGYAVTAPEAPYHEGYVFLGWEYGLTNIRDNMEIHARYIPKEYVVVYIDWLNGTANMVTNVAYGSQLNLPEVTAPEGYEFIGWTAPDGLSVDSVSDNMIVTAEYEQKTVNVTFTDANGEELDTSTVLYGEVPYDPLTDFYEGEDPMTDDDEEEVLTSLNASLDDGDDEEYTIEDVLLVPEGMYFTGWAEEAYCPATQELVLTPNLEYVESAVEATVSLEGGLYYGSQTLEISCEDENTEFTYGYVSIEGIDEIESELEYTGPITIDKSCVIRVTTSAEGKNSTELELEYTIIPADSKPAAPENVKTAESEDGLALSWNAVAGAEGYYISKTDAIGNEERFMSDTNAYTDTNVSELEEYSYSVTAYSMYETDYAELLLESESSEETKTKYFGSCTPVETLTIQNAPETMLDGSTVQLTAVATPDNAYNKEVIWSTDSECLYVTEEGLLMASGSGSGTVTATAADGSGATAIANVTVEIPQSGGATLTVSSTELVRENPSEVTVTLSENRGIAAMQFAVLYDSTQVELASCTEGSAMTGKSPTINSATPGVVYFNWESINPLYSGGELLKLSFKAKTDISKAQLSVEIPTESDEYDFVFADANQTDVSAATVNGVLSVSEYKLGDVNSDGSVNVIDASLIRRYAARFTDVEFSSIQKLNADVNGDGKINVLDASLIRRYAAKLIEEFPAAG